MTAAAKEERQVSLFVRRQIDDYGLDPYEFRLYARISRRAGNEDGEAWESVPSMARACCMSVSRARTSLQLLELAKLVESIERPGYSTLRRLTSQHKWVAPERLPELRRFIRLSKLPTSTPTKFGRGTKSATPTKSDGTPLSNLIALPLPNLTAEGTPSEVNPNKVLPQSPLTPQGKQMGEGKEKKEQSNQTTISGSSLIELSGQLASLLENALKPVFANLVAETKQALSGITAPKEANGKEPSPKPKQQAKTCRADEATQSPQILEELSRLVDESVESLRLNPNLSNALTEHHQGVSDALLYFKQALATWKKKPGLGLFISALRKGLKPCPTAPGGGWKEWADEAKRRHLMDYSMSHEGDIIVYFISGAKKLWSEIRSFEWSELEALVAAPCSEGCPA